MLGIHADVHGCYADGVGVDTCAVVVVVVCVVLAVVLDFICVHACGDGCYVGGAVVGACVVDVAVVVVVCVVVDVAVCRRLQAIHTSCTASFVCTYYVLHI